jgi:hypothetical protein
MAETRVTQVRILTVIAALVLWETMARSGLFYRDVVPSVVAVAAAVGDEVVDAGL